MTARLSLLLAVGLLAGCSGATPVPSAQPVANVPTQAPPATTPGLSIVPCSDATCEDGAYHVTHDPAVGDTITLRYTVKNSGPSTSGPVGGLFLGCTTNGGCRHDEFWLPDRFTILGCSPQCTFNVTNDNTTWELQWAGAVKPGATADLTVTFKATVAGDNYIQSTLSEATLDQMYKDAPGLRKLGEWENMEIEVQ